MACFRAQTRRVTQRSGHCALFVSLLVLASLDAGLSRAEPIAALPQSDTQAVSTQAQELLGSASGRAGDLMAEPVVFAPFADVPTVAPVFGTAPVLAQTPPPTGTGEAQQAPPTPTTEPTAPAATEPASPDLEADEVVVTGTRRAPEPEPTGTKFTITKEEIEAVGARTISDAIRLAPGINIIDSLGGISSERSTFVRGLDSRRFVFLIDGRPLTRPQDNRAADVGRISASNVERIEVITGGAALRYSADAVAGVINVITSVPDEQFSLRTSNTGGSYGYARHTVDLSGTNGLQRNAAGYLAYEFNYERRSAYNNYTGSFTEAPIGLGISGIRSEDPQNPLPRLNFTGDGDEFTPVSEGGFVQVPVTVGTRLNAGYTFNDSYNAKTIFNPGQDHTVTLGFSQLNSRLGDQFALPNQLGTCNITPEGYNQLLGSVTSAFPSRQSAAVFCNTYPGDGSIDGLQGIGDQAQDDTGAFFVWDWKLSELNLLTTQVSFTSAFNNYPSSPGTKFVSNRSLDAQLRYRAELYPGNTLNTGFQFTTLRYNATPELGVGPEGVQRFGNLFVPVDRETNRWSIYITEDLRFFENTLTASLGTRLTNDLLFGTFVTSGAGLRYDFGGPLRREPLTFRVNWSQAFKTPGLSQLFGYGAYNFAGSNIGPPFLGLSTTYLRNPNLRPETATSYDIGIDYRVSPSMLFRATYYRIDLSSVLVDDTFIGLLGDSGAGAFTAINGQSYASTGFELSYNWKIDPQWSLQTSFSTSDSRPKGNAAADVFTNPRTGETEPLDFGINGGYFYEYQAFDVPFNTTGISVRYATPEFRAALTGQLFGLRPRALGGPYYYPGYSRWDFTFAFPISPFLTVTAGIFNIFNDRSILAAGNVPIGGSIISPPTTFRVGIESAF
ncbi:MAG: TonB-dependent receptor [Gemmatimonadaceae bacterium]|nr:TonB-dependent receptor [Gloeobacterales cyanobacterium ES-bin-141]